MNTGVPGFVGRMGRRLGNVRFSGLTRTAKSAEGELVLSSMAADAGRGENGRLKKPNRVIQQRLVLALCHALVVTGLTPGRPVSIAAAVPDVPPANVAAYATDRLSRESLLTRVQERTFQYFWDGAESHSGLACERIHIDGDYPRQDQHVVTTGGTGFGVMAILVGVERGFITRTAALTRLERIVGFLETADRYHGAWPHWLDGRTARTVPFSLRDDGADLVETAFLMQGLLAVRQYLTLGTSGEQSLAGRIDKLWRQIEWNWFRREGDDVLTWHWSPRHGWAMNHPIRGYNECLITYVLAAASPTHGVPAHLYHEGWARSGAIVARTEGDATALGLKHNGADERGGPLFWAHYSFLGLDPRGLKDRYADYWQENLNHTLLNRAHCVGNSGGFAGYGENCWGLTASYSVNFYAAHDPGHDLGVISPTAALSSYPYAPDEVWSVLEHFYYDLGDRIFGPYGFYDAFSEEKHWYPQRYLAIDQGPIVIMIENHRTGLLWKLFMSCPEVTSGLRKLGFETGQ